MSELEQAWRGLLKAATEAGLPTFLFGMWVGMVVMLVAAVLTDWAIR